MVDMPPDRRRLIYLVLASFIIIGFFMVNGIFKIGAIYAMLAGLSLIVILQWDRIPKKKGEFRLFGVQKDWFVDGLWGGIVGIGFIMFSNLFAISLAIPFVPLALNAQWITTSFVAPIVEEVFFRVVLFAILFAVFGFSFIIANLIQATTFSVYHVTAYAGVISASAILSVGGAFLAAFLFGFIVTYVIWWRGGQMWQKGAAIAGSIVAGIVMHSVINSILFAAKAVVF